MRRSNVVIERVSAPSKGLITRIPSNVTSPDRRAIVAGQNVRAERGVLSAAPGYERVVPDDENLDSPANLIFQANILNQDREIATTPFIGTGSRLYAVRRRARALSCLTGGGGSGGTCAIRVGLVGDSGKVGTPLDDIADLVKSWDPDFLIHLGDLVYTDGGEEPTISDFEEVVGRPFWEYIGGYNGLYGIGPSTNKFFPVLGNHDWDDGGIDSYTDFFRLPENPNERYYHYKRGPAHFIHYSGYEAEEPDGVSLGSTQADWLEGVLAASDCPFVFLVVHFPLFTSDDNHYPGSSALQTLIPLLIQYNVTAVLSGHSHNSEIVVDQGVTQLISGGGGHSLRPFNDPVATGSVWRDNSDYTALLLDCDRTTATFKWYSRTGSLLQTHEFTNPREEAGDICYIGDVAKEVFTLTVKPSEAAVEVGHTWPYRAYANYQDGNVEDVTEECVWVSEDDAIGTVANSGIATGISPGIVTLTATYKEVSGTAEFMVLYSCLDDPTEIVFVVDRSTQMGVNASGVTRLERVKDGIGRALDGFDSTRDFAGLVSFAGEFDTQTEDAVLESVLTSDFDSVRDALSLLVPDGERSIAEALDVTRAELESSRHVDGNPRVAILVTSGPADVTDPGGSSASYSAGVTAAMTAAGTAATAIKALDDTILIVVGYNIPASYVALVRALATTGYFFHCNTPDEIEKTLAGIPNMLCAIDDPYYYPPDPDEELRCGMPIADFRDLINWEILRGTVDLCGVGPGGELDPYSLAFDVWPGNGMYLDLVGTLVRNAPDYGQPDATTCAKLRSREAFDFEGGKTYKLTIYLAGNKRFSVSPYDSLDTTISIDNGVLSNQVITVSDWEQPPSTAYDYTFTPGSDTTGRIIIDHEVFIAMSFPTRPEIAHPRVGNVLMRVVLENTTDTVTLLDDNFDFENPCEL